jgi:hypothetical protein
VAPPFSSVHALEALGRSAVQVRQVDVHGNLLSERTQSNLLANTSEEESEITLMTLPQILRGEALDLAQIMSCILRMGSVGPPLPHLNRGWAHPCHI